MHAVRYTSSRSFLLFGLAVVLGGMPATGHADNLGAIPSAFNRSAAEGAPLTPDQFQIRNATSDMPLDFRISQAPPWLTVAPVSGVCTSTPTTVTLTYLTTHLPVGTYNGVLAVESNAASNAPLEVAVNVTVTPSAMTIRVEPPAIELTFTEGMLSSTTSVIEVWNGGTAGVRQMMPYSVSDNATWLSVPAGGGSSTGERTQHTLQFSGLSQLAAGTYTAEVTVAAPGYAVNTPQVVPVTLHVKPNITLTLDPPAVEMWTTLGMLPTSAQLQVRTSGGIVPVTIASLSPWLTASPTSGLASSDFPVNVTLSAQSREMAAGTYYTAVTVNAEGGAQAQCTVKLTISPNGMVLAYDGTFKATAPVGSAPVETGMGVWNRGGTEAISYRAWTMVQPGDPGWLSVAPAVATTGADRVIHTLSFDPAGLAEGTYQVMLSVTPLNAGTWPPSTTVVFEVCSALTSTPAAVELTMEAGQAAPPAVLQLRNAGSANPVGFSLISSDPSVTATPSAGILTTSQSVTVNVDTAVLPVGHHAFSLRLLGYCQEVDIPVFVHVTEARGRFDERLVFDADLDGDSDLWTMPPRAGAAPRKLYAKPGDQHLVGVSRDGLRVLFTEDDTAGTVGRVLSLETGTETDLGPVFAPVWMPESDSILDASSATPPMTLDRVGLDGRRQVLVRDRDYCRPAAVGQLNSTIYYFQSARRLGPSAVKSFRIGTGAVRAVAPSGTGARLDGDLHPDEKTLAYRLQSRLGTTVRTTLRTTPTRPSTDDGAFPGVPTDADCLGAAFSPDGRRIALVQRRLNRSAIVLAAARGGAQTELAAESGAERFGGAIDWVYLYAVEPAIAVTPALITLSGTQGSTNLVAGAFAITNTGNAFLQYELTANVPWLGTAPSFGACGGESDTIVVQANAGELAAGVHTGVVRVASNGGADQSVRVAFTVAPAPAVIGTLAEVNAAGIAGGAAVVLQLPVWNEGYARLNATVSTGDAWIRVLTPAVGCDGSTSGPPEVVHARVSLSPGTLVAGTYEGKVRLTAGSQWKDIGVHFQVANPAAAVLAVTPERLSVTVPRFQTARDARFDVRNAGGGSLAFYVTGDANWLETLPATSATDLWPCGTDGTTQRVRFRSQNLAEGTYNATLTVHSAVGDAALPVALTVAAPERYALVVNVIGNGSVLYVPASADGRYAHGTRVDMRAQPGFGQECVYWDGVGGRTLEPIRSTAMTAERRFDVSFRPRARLYGNVRNAVTHEALHGAAVEVVGLGDDETDGYGLYSFFVSGRDWVSARASRPGYKTAAWVTCLVTAGAQIKEDFDLQPEVLRNVSAHQLPGTKIVEVTYDLVGQPYDRREVQLDFSDNQQLNWNIVPAPGSLTGQVGTGIRPAKGLRIRWNAEPTHNLQRIDEMAARVRVDGVEGVSGRFGLNTARRSAVVRVYGDKNRNGRYDPGEALADAECYAGGRTPEHFAGGSDASGCVSLGAISPGSRFFARKAMYARAAEKESHGAVDNTMYRLYLDSDVGPASDEDTTMYRRWETYQFSDAQWQAAGRGEVVDVPLKHALFVYNLIVDIPGEHWMTVPQQRYEIAAAKASRYLYQITYGQMKFNKIYFTYRDEGARKNADVEIHRGAGRASAYVGGIWSDEMWWYQTDINIHELDQTWHFPDVGESWSRTLVHEFLHYALTFRDEYITGEMDQYEFTDCRLKSPAFYPPNYGAMDNESGTIQLSSWNDYAPGVEDLHWAVVDSIMPKQFGSYRRPCWTDWQRYHEVAFGGVPIELIGPPTGRFVDGRSTSQDRQFAPAVNGPYPVCQTKWETGPWVERTNEEANPNARVTGAPDATVKIRCRRDGIPWTNAAVAVYLPYVGIMPAPASGLMLMPTVTKYTGKHGVCTIMWLPADCTLKVQDGGVTKALARVAGVPSTFDFDFTDFGADGQALHVLALADADAPVPLQVAASLMGELVQLRLWTGVGLVSNPVVVAHHQAGKALVSVTNVVFAGGMDGRTFMTTLDLSKGYAGQVEIRGLAADGRTLYRADDFETFLLNTNPAPSEVIVRGSAGALRLNTRSVLYRSNGPFVRPAGYAQPTNQVGPSFAVTLDMGRNLDAANFVFVDLPLGPHALGGLDAGSLTLLRWNDAPGGQQWLAVTSPVSVSLRGDAHCRVTANGLYALAAQSSIDRTAPAAVADLQAAPGDDFRAVALTWTAPGDDGATGTAAAYELRFAETPIADEDAWERATVLPLPVAPTAGGTVQQTVVQAPESDVLYDFALRARDEAGNLGPLGAAAEARAALGGEAGAGVPADVLASYSARAGHAVLETDDTDNDGLTTWDEYLRDTDALTFDTDGDDMGDGFEANGGLNPLSIADRDLDLDGDTLRNVWEHALGTHPGRVDTDGDGMDDPWEAEKMLDPLTAGRSDGADADPDNDRFSNFKEFVADTDPKNAASYLRVERLLRQPAGVAVEFHGSQHREFLIESTPDMLSDNWLRLEAFRPGAGAPAMSVVDTNNLPAAAYRIRARKP